MSDLWTMWIYNGRGDFWDRVEGSDDNLRGQGVNITTLRGQMAWRCSLRKNGRHVAECRRGVWKDVTP